MIDLKCQIEQRHFLYLSNRTVNAIVSLIYDFNHLIYILVWLTHWKIYIYGIVNILKVKQCKKFCISVPADFFLSIGHG